MGNVVYQGRLWTDGNGNLLAYDVDADGNKGPNHGLPVAHDLSIDKYVYLNPGEPSHNAQHHKGVKEVIATQDQDAEQPGFAGSVKEPTEGNEHHFEAHIDRSGDTFNTLPDALASITASHTAAYEGKGGK